MLTIIALLWAFKSEIKIVVCLMTFTKSFFAKLPTILLMTVTHSME